MSAVRVTKVKALGGNVMKDKSEDKDMGWLAIIIDPTGAMLGLWKSKIWGRRPPTARGRPNGG